jgi:hypothetical protein
MTRTRMDGRIAAVAAVVLLSAGSAGASGSAALEGRYGLTGMGTCLSAPNGFYPNKVASDPSSASATVNQGVLTFERDGTGSATVYQTQLNLPPAQATYSSSAQVTFRFTHQLQPDGALTVDMLLDTYAATYLTGPSAGLSAGFVTTPPLAPTWVWTGSVGNDRKTLLLNNGDTVSKLRFSNGAEVYVICQFDRVLTRLTP